MGWGSLNPFKKGNVLTSFNPLGQGSFLNPVTTVENTGKVLKGSSVLGTMYDTAQDDPLARNVVESMTKIDSTAKYQANRQLGLVLEKLGLDGGYGAKFRQGQMDQYNPDGPASERDRFKDGTEIALKVMATLYGGDYLSGLGGGGAAEGGATAADLAAADAGAGLIPAEQSGAATMAGGGTGVVGGEIAAGGGVGVAEFNPNGLPQGSRYASDFPTGGGMATGSTGGGFASAANAGASLIGTYLQAAAAADAARLQADAANNATALQRYQYEQTRSDATPWRVAGETSLNKLMGLLNSGELTSKFAGMNPMEEKGYAFQAREGQRAIDNSASARGGIGGAALKAGARFAEDNANKHYNDAFNRFQTERTNTTNPLYQIAGFGPQANQQVQRTPERLAELRRATSTRAGSTSSRPSATAPGGGKISRRGNTCQSIPRCTNATR
jgi:hypothetical protein